MNIPTSQPREPLEVARRAKAASIELALAPRANKDRALVGMAERLVEHSDAILDANSRDLEAASAGGLPSNVTARLRFGEEKILARARSLHKIAELPDPVGQTIRSETRPGGLRVARVRVPLGVILMVFEARPHVTVNAGAFCVKSGNAAILRGGSEAAHCNALLGRLWRDSVVEAKLPEDAVQVLSGTHEQIRDLLQLDEYIDLVIPRGGKGLIRAVNEHSRIPVIKHFEGVCHVYLDQIDDLEAAIAVVLDSKCLMPEVCNAAETLLVSSAAAEHIPAMISALADAGVTVRGCERVRRIDSRVEAADDEDWTTEYLDMILSVRVVDGVDEAIEHINRYGSHHTDAIVTGNADNAARFRARVDSGVVLVNASTMFCDGESLGMGAEIGISTDKIHARGPMGLEELTSYKFCIEGDGHVMGTWPRRCPDLL